MGGGAQGTSEAAQEGGGVTQGDVEVAASEQVRLAFDNPVEAFMSMQDTIMQRALRSVQNYAFGTVEIPKDSDELFHTFRQGMVDFQNPHLVAVAEEGDSTHPARLPFTLTSDMKLCLYIAGTTRFRSEHLHAGELQGGMKQLLGPVGITPTLAHAQALIDRWDSSSFVCKDNRMHLADFGRWYRNGTDPAFKVLNDVAGAIVRGEVDAMRGDVRERTAKARTKVSRRGAKVLAEEAAQQRGECRAARLARDVETILERLKEEVERSENGGLRRSEAVHPPTFGLAMRLASMDAGGKGEISTGQLAFALEATRLGVTPCEALIMGGHFATLPGGTRLRWPAFLIAVDSGVAGGEGCGDAEVEAAARAQLAAHREALDAPPPPPPAPDAQGEPAPEEDQTPPPPPPPSAALRPVLPLPSDPSDKDLFDLARLLSSPLAAKAVHTLLSDCAYLRKMMRSLDTKSFAALSGKDLTYALKGIHYKLSEARHGMLMSTYASGVISETGLRSFDGPRILYSSLLREVVPIMAELDVEQAGKKLPVLSGDERWDGDLVAALANLSHRVHGPTFKLAEALSKAWRPVWAPEGSLLPREVGAAVKESLGVDLPEEDLAWALYHFPAPKYKDVYLNIESKGKGKHATVELVLEEVKPTIVWVKLLRMMVAACDLVWQAEEA